MTRAAGSFLRVCFSADAFNFCPVCTESAREREREREAGRKEGKKVEGVMEPWVKY